MQFVTIEYAICYNSTAKKYAICYNRKTQVFDYKVFVIKKSLKTIKSIDIDYILSTDTKNKKKWCLWSVKRTQFFIHRERKRKKSKKSISLVGGLN
jgi:hypothetical protein